MAGTRLIWKGKELEKLIGQKSARNMQTAAYFLEGEIKKSMKAGGGRGKSHIPAPPGEPPHVDTGRLRRSITHEIEVTDKGVIGRIGTNVDYGRYLELGTSRMKARPFLRPGLEKNKRKIARILGRE